VGLLVVAAQYVLLGLNLIVNTGLLGNEDPLMVIMGLE